MARAKHSKDKDGTVGEWAKLAKVGAKELTMVGAEKADEKATAKHPQAKLGPKGGPVVMPSWVFDNDFEGLPPLNPNDELTRMEKELSSVMGEMDKLSSRSTAVTKKVPNESIREETPNIIIALEESYKRVQQEQQRREPTATVARVKDKDKKGEGKADDPPSKP